MGGGNKKHQQNKNATRAKQKRKKKKKEEGEEEKVKKKKKKEEEEKKCSGRIYAVPLLLFHYRPICSCQNVSGRRDSYVIPFSCRHFHAHNFRGQFSEFFCFPKQNLSIVNVMAVVAIFGILRDEFTLAFLGLCTKCYRQR